MTAAQTIRTSLALAADAHPQSLRRRLLKTTVGLLVFSILLSAAGLALLLLGITQGYTMTALVGTMVLCSPLYSLLVFRRRLLFLVKHLRLSSVGGVLLSIAGIVFADAVALVLIGWLAYTTWGA